MITDPWLLFDASTMSMLRLALAAEYRRGYRDGTAATTVKLATKDPVISPRLPFRDRPELDVEFYGQDGELLGDGTAALKANVNASGIILTGTAQYTAQRTASVSSLTVWVGDEQRRGLARRPVTVNQGDCLFINFAMPFGLRPGDFWWGNDGDPDPAPKPTEDILERDHG